MNRKGFKTNVLLIWLFLTAICTATNAQQSAHMLVVIAHPDDESAISVTLFKLAKEQKAIVDLFVITNGEAGFHYSALAEQYYGCKLLDEKYARKNLPAIRKKELKESASILGVSNLYYANQIDSHYSTNEREPLDTSWVVAAVRKNLRRLLTHNNYDYILCLLPEAGTHAGHKAATLIALEELSKLPANHRPIILGAKLLSKTDTAFAFNCLKNYELSQTTSSKAPFTVDRTTWFGFNNKINYKVVANWELAAYKSQGATQMTMNEGELEEFWYFAINPIRGLDKTAELFNYLKQSPYKKNNKTAIVEQVSISTK